MTLNRRGLLLGLASALAAPAIVHAGNLMPVRAVSLMSDHMAWLPPLQDEIKDLHNLMLDAANRYWIRRLDEVQWCEVTAEDFYARRMDRQARKTLKVFNDKGVQPIFGNTLPQRTA